MIHNGEKPHGFVDIVLIFVAYFLIEYFNSGRNFRWKTFRSFVERRTHPRNKFPRNLVCKFLETLYKIQCMFKAYFFLNMNRSLEGHEKNTIKLYLYNALLLRK